MYDILDDLLAKYWNQKKSLTKTANKLKISTLADGFVGKKDLEQKNEWIKFQSQRWTILGQIVFSCVGFLGKLMKL